MVAYGCICIAGDLNAHCSFNELCDSEIFYLQKKGISIKELLCFALFVVVAHSRH